MTGLGQNQPSFYPPSNFQLDGRIHFGAKKPTDEPTGKELPTEKKKKNEATPSDTASTVNTTEPTPPSSAQVSSDIVEIGSSDRIKVKSLKPLKEAKNEEATDKAASKQQKKAPPKKAKKSGSTFKENLKVVMALNFNLVVPIAASFLWALGPVGLLSIPISYFSGRFGQKLMDNVDSNKTSGLAEKIKTIDDHMNNPEAKKAEALEQLKADGKINAKSTQEEIDKKVESYQGDVIDNVVDELVDGILNIKIPVVTKLLDVLLKGKMSKFLKSYLKIKSRKAGGANKFAFRLSTSMAARKSGSNQEGAIKTATNIGKAGFHHFIFWRLDDVLVGMGTNMGGAVGWTLRGIGTALRYLIPLMVGKEAIKDVRNAT